MPIRLIAIDLDGTLLDSSRQISPANSQALADAAARGVQVVIVTGRRFHSAERLVRLLPHPVTLIASNGALIGSSSGEILYRDFLPSLVACKVLRIASEYRPYAVAIFDQPGRGQVTMQQNAAPEGPAGWYLANSPECLYQVPDLEAAITTDPVEIMFGGPPKFIEPVESLLRASPAAPEIHLSWTKYLTRNISILDIMNRGCSKGRSLKLWAERCGISRDEVMAIGDNFNDLEMLEFAGQPVVMANCTEGLARDGWPITLSNDQDGVARAIENYVLRKA
ncbi:MAG TPA: Cof-type HAD-IIB family hydrolase [Terriglobia bacterium]|nr:Cof-type HAD-IIB family hydrolase [Terriglobia bacterium]